MGTDFVIYSQKSHFYDLKKLFEETKPAAVIHAAAQSDPNFYQENHDTSYRMNTEVAINIAGLCSDLEIPCLFISSDLVFDGLNPPCIGRNSRPHFETCLIRI